jgi:hypothetical protein
MQRHIFKYCRMPGIPAVTFAIGGLLMASVVGAQDDFPEAPQIAVQQEQPAAEGEIEVLMRGPVHEAYAEQFVLDPEPGLLIPKEPPEPLDELPPESVPEGENIEWVGGYWGWDDEREDFIWISGIWRSVPPGQRWVPGYWIADADGYRWSPGFWLAAQVEELSYLPQPPPSREAGPPGDPPSEQHFWVPGNWLSVGDSFRWRAGYWAAAPDNWVWMPARYVWTPLGFVFLDGYWDYPIVQRGVMFAPVYCPGYVCPQFVPQHVIPAGPMLVHLFVRPAYHHYYFGNFYGDPFVNMGIFPWVTAHQFVDFAFYDPLWMHYRFTRFGAYEQLVGWNRYFLANERVRPPVTFAEFQRFEQQITPQVDAAVVRQTGLVQPFNEFARRDDIQFAFRSIDEQQRRQFTERSRALRDLARERQEVELADRERIDTDVEANVRAQTRLELPRTDDLPRRPTHRGERRTARPPIGERERDEQRRPRIGERPERDQARPRVDDQRRRRIDEEPRRDDLDPRDRQDRRLRDMEERRLRDFDGRRPRDLEDRRRPGVDDRQVPDRFEDRQPRRLEDQRRDLDDRRRPRDFGDRPQPRFDDRRMPERFDDRQPGRFDDPRQRGMEERRFRDFDDQQDRGFDNRRQPEFDARQSGRFDDRQPRRFDARQPSRFDDRQPGRFDARQPSRFDDRQPGRFDDRQPGRFDDRQPGRFDDRQPGRFDARQPGRFDGQQPGIDSRQMRDFDNRGARGFYDRRQPGLDDRRLGNDEFRRQPQRTQERP